MASTLPTRRFSSSQVARTNPFQSNEPGYGQNRSEAPLGMEFGKQWNVKITIWRFANACLILGLGIKKAILAFQNNPAVNAFDAALGLAWVFIIYCGSIVENERPQLASWLFEADITHVLIIAGWYFLFCSYLVGMFALITMGINFTTANFSGKISLTLAMGFGFTILLINVVLLNLLLPEVIYRVRKLSIGANIWHPAAVFGSLTKDVWQVLIAECLWVPQLALLPMIFRAYPPLFENPYMCLLIVYPMCISLYFACALSYPVRRIISGLWGRTS